MIGKFIKQKREAAGMTQAELYEHLPTTKSREKGPHAGRSKISKLESGANVLTLKQFQAIARALNMKPSELLAEFEAVTQQ